MTDERHIYPTIRPRSAGAHVTMPPAPRGSTLTAAEVVIAAIVTAIVIIAVSVFLEAPTP